MILLIVIIPSLLSLPFFILSVMDYSRCKAAFLLQPDTGACNKENSSNSHLEFVTDKDGKKKVNDGKRPLPPDDELVFSPLERARMEAGKYQYTPNDIDIIRDDETLKRAEAEKEREKEAASYVREITETMANENFELGLENESFF